MSKSDDTNEILLSAWLKLAFSVRENRILQTISFSEMTVLHILVTAREDGIEYMTASELCQRSRLLKSQMNRVLNALEEKNYIVRIKPEEDRRKTYVAVADPIPAEYVREHEHVLSVMNRVTEALGEDGARQLAELLLKARGVFI